MDELGPAPAGSPPDTAAVRPVVQFTGPDLSSPATLTVHFSAAALQGLSPQRVAVLQQDADGSWSAVPALVGTDGTVTCYVRGAGDLVAVAGTRQYPDLVPGSWARP